MLAQRTPFRYVHNGHRSDACTTNTVPIRAQRTPFRYVHNEHRFRCVHNGVGSDARERLRLLQNKNNVLLTIIIIEVIHAQIYLKKKWKVFYSREPHSGESTTTKCGVNYQLLAVIIEVAQWGTPSCSRPQPATDNDIRDGRSNWLVALPTLMGSTPWAPRAYIINRCTSPVFDLATYSHHAYAATQGLKPWEINKA